MMTMMMMTMMMMMMMMMMIPHTVTNTHNIAFVQLAVCADVVRYADSRPGC